MEQEQPQEYLDIQHDGRTINLSVKRKNISPEGLMAEVVRVRDAKRDIVLPSQDIEAVVVDNDVKLRVVMPGNEGIANFGLTEWAHRQLGEKLGIPIRYYAKMRESEKLNLLAANVNGWIQTKEKRMLRTLEGKVRAVLSDKFQPIDNWLIAAEAFRKFEEMGLTADNIDSCNLTQTHMYLRATVPWMEAEVRRGDTLRQGIIISNSEVGAGAFRCEPFLWRQVCSNGLIAPSALLRVHLGARREAGDVSIFSDETNSLELNLIISKIHDLIENTFNQEYFDTWIAKLQSSAETRVDAPVEVVDKFAKMYNITDKVKETVLNNFVKEGNATQWGFVNAITATARDFEDAGAQTDLERIAGEVSYMDEPEFRKKLAPIPVA